MNGHEHYRQAERLLAKARYWDDDVTECENRELRALAAIHATLALAAATALGALTRQAIERPIGVSDTETQDALNDWHATITIAAESEATE
ncbi:hypothetical protein HH308_06440 [Gordonia sp. TBRC 11910]|uniref:Uncharacterized protein n=1 Tax=Gordonia asplenii TaxID=2725283 RepID=A0A848KXD4_9ACTN|nr:hypothetical protein [Gordonia asplenii]NMO00851.1 hypothetical protein [Gordonia asplenii]